jgi:hypothetical protein
MPSSTDTARLVTDLESIAEAVRDIQRKAREVLQRVADNEAADIADRLANAAIAAGMPPARAFGYAEEYLARLSSAKKDLEVTEGVASHAKKEIEALVHIATVVPYRCPNPGAAGGRPALVLTN